MEFNYEDTKFYADKLRGHCNTSGPWWSTLLRFVPMFDEVTRLRLEIERLQSVEKAQEWIPVSERLPEPNKRIQFFGGFEQTTHIGYYREHATQWESENGGFWHGRNFILITHWQPLPPPPTGGKND
ncbi:MAG: DUF551 domain-containing protein [Clostridia bacterium]